MCVQFQNVDKTDEMGNYISSMAFPVPAVGPLPKEARFYRTRTGKVIPIVHYAFPGSAFTVILSHGNGTDLSCQDQFLKKFCKRLRLSIVCYEYIGYGHSYDEDSESSFRLQPSENGCYESVNAAFEYVSNVLHVPAKQQIWLGHSIGSGPTVDLAARIGDNDDSMDAIAGVILISPFTSATDVAAPFFSFIYNMFANRNKVHRIRSDVLLLHGTDDELIPFSHSERLVEARQRNAHNKTHLKPIRSATHHDMFAHEETWLRIEEFVQYLGARQ